MDKKPTEIININGNVYEVNLNYQYEDHDITAILNARLNEYNFQIEDARIHNMAAVVVNFEGATQADQLQQRLEEDKEHNNKGKRIVLIPCNIGNSHWVGLLLEFDENNACIRAEYMDSMKRDVPQDDLDNRLTDYYQTKFRKVENIIKQNDLTSCGPCTIENLMLRINEEAAPPANENYMSQIRAQHVHVVNAHSDQPGNQNGSSFYERQRLNQTTMSDTTPSANKNKSSTNTKANKKNAASKTDKAQPIFSPGEQSDLKKEIDKIIEEMKKDESFKKIATEIYRAMKDADNLEEIETHTLEQEQKAQFIKPEALDALARLLTSDQVCAAVGFDTRCQQFVIAANYAQHLDANLEVNSQIVELKKECHGNRTSTLHAVVKTESVYFGKKSEPYIVHLEPSQHQIPLSFKESQKKLKPISYDGFYTINDEGIKIQSPNNGLKELKIRWKSQFSADKSLVPLPIIHPFEYYDIDTTSEINKFIEDFKKKSYRLPNPIPVETRFNWNQWRAAMDHLFNYLIEKKCISTITANLENNFYKSATSMMLDFKILNTLQLSLRGQTESLIQEKINYRIFHLIHETYHFISIDDKNDPEALKTIGNLISLTSVIFVKCQEKFYVYFHSRDENPPTIKAKEIDPEKKEHIQFLDTLAKENYFKEKKTINAGIETLPRKIVAAFYPNKTMENYKFINIQPNENETQLVQKAFQPLDSNMALFVKQAGGKKSTPQFFLYVTDKNNELIRKPITDKNYVYFLKSIPQKDFSQRKTIVEKGCKIDNTLIRIREIANSIKAPFNFGKKHNDLIIMLLESFLFLKHTLSRLTNNALSKKDILTIWGHLLIDKNEKKPLVSLKLHEKNNKQHANINFIIPLRDGISCELNLTESIEEAKAFCALWDSHQRKIPNSAKDEIIPLYNNDNDADTIKKLLVYISGVKLTKNYSVYLCHENVIEQKIDRSSYNKETAIYISQEMVLIIENGEKIFFPFSEYMPHFQDLAKIKTTSPTMTEQRNLLNTIIGMGNIESLEEKLKNAVGLLVAASKGKLQKNIEDELRLIKTYVKETLEDLITLESSITNQKDSLISQQTLKSYHADSYSLPATTYFPSPTSDYHFCLLNIQENKFNKFLETHKNKLQEGIYLTSLFTGAQTGEDLTVTARLITKNKKSESEKTEEIKLCLTSKQIKKSDWPEEEWKPNKPNDIEKNITQISVDYKTRYDIISKFEKTPKIVNIIESYENNIHAEVRILTHFLTQGEPGQIIANRYIGISKHCCFQCKWVMDQFGIATRRKNGSRISFAGWRLPQNLITHHTDTLMGEKLKPLFDKQQQQQRDFLIKLIQYLGDAGGQLTNYLNQTIIIEDRNKEFLNLLAQRRKPTRRHSFSFFSIEHRLHLAENKNEPISCIRRKSSI